MSNPTSTTSFKADISQLKSAMQQASRSVKLAASEFKAATAGMDNWRTSAEGLNAKLKQLKTTLTAQKSQLGLLEEQLELTEKEYGKNSAAADRVRMSINNQKAAIAQTEKQMGEYTEELGKAEKYGDNFNETLEESEKASQKASDGFSVMKGVLASLAADGIRLVISGFKSMADEAINAYKEFDNASDIMVAKTGATGEQLESLRDSYTAVAGTVVADSESIGSAIGQINTKFGLEGEELESLSTKMLEFSQLNNTDVSNSIDKVYSAMTAWGVSTEDAGTFLDLLNATGQKTGASVDTLTSSLTTNAASLKDMGFSVEQATTFLGQLELAGVDSSTVMTGLKKALANSAKEGKSTKDSLADLQAVMSGTSTDAEKTQAAMELFGTKAGPAIAEACKTGRLNFEDLGKAMEGYEGNLDKTYEATLDGTDRIKLRFQSMKAEAGQYIKEFVEGSEGDINDLMDLIGDSGKSILGSVKENAPQIKNTIKGTITFITKLITGLINNFDDIAQIVKSVGTVMLATFVVSKIASFATTIVGLVKTFQTLKTATEGATTAQQLLNVAQNANVIGAVTAAVAGLTAAVLWFVSASDEERNSIETLNDYEQQQVDKVLEMSKAYQELEQSRDEAVAGVEAEYGHYEELATELDNLVDANGRVKTGYEDRANFIITTLNDAIGTEMQLVDGVIQNYDSETSSIYQLIEAKKAQAVLDANEEAYTTAIKGQDEALQNYITTQGIYQQNVAEMESAKARLSALTKQEPEEWAKANGVVGSSVEIYDKFAGEVQKVSDELTSAQGAVGESRRAMELAEDTYVGYQSTIQNYEGLSSAIISGDADKIATSLKNMEANFITAETGTRESLERQVKDMQTNYQNLLTAQQNGSDVVTDSMVNDAKEMVDKATNELNRFGTDGVKSVDEGMREYTAQVKAKKGDVEKANKEVGEAGADSMKTPDKYKQSGKYDIEGFTGGVLDAKPEALKAVEGVGTGSINSLNTAIGAQSPSKKTKLSGNYFGQGFINGMDEKSSAIYQKAYELGKTAINAIKSAQQEGSPSKITTRSGEFFGTGYENGINKMQGAVKNAATNLAYNAIKTLKETQQEGSPSKVTYISGVLFSEGYINGIASMQSELQKTVKGMVKTTLTTALDLKNYDFAKTSKNVADYLSKELASRTSHMVLVANNEVSKALDELQSGIDKLMEEKAQEMSNYESKISSATTDLDKAGLKKQKAQVEAYYDDLIAKQKQVKDDYQTASNEMIKQFTTAVNEYSSQAQDLINSTIDGISDKYQQKYDELINKQNNLISKLKSAGSLFEVSGAGVMTIGDLTKQTEQIRDYTRKLQEIKKQVSSELFDEIASFDMKEGSAYIDRLLAMSKDDLKAYNEAYNEKMKAAEELAEKTYKSDFDNISESYKNEIAQAFKTIPSQLEQLGVNAMKGFVNGMTSNTDFMSDQVQDFVQSIIDTFKSELQIASPSKVMMRLGGFTGGGFVEGFKKQITNVKKAANNMAKSVSIPLEDMRTNLGRVKANVADGSAAVTASNTTINNYNLVQNNTSPKALTSLETYQARRQQVALIKALT